MGDGRRGVKLVGSVGERWWSGDVNWQIRDAGRWMRNGGYRWARSGGGEMELGIVGWWMRDGASERASGCEMGHPRRRRDVRCGLRDVECGIIRDVGREMRDVRCELWDARCGMRDGRGWVMGDGRRGKGD